MSSSEAFHVPVLIGPLLAAVSPVRGTWLDGTFGAGGYARALLEAGAERVIALDRDPSVLEAAQGWAGQYGERLVLIEERFGRLDTRIDGPLDGVVLDLGVSSMQLDRAERGFSFLREGPLDMRMEQAGPSAKDLVNQCGERKLADILYQYGEERASRRIARAIVKARPIETTTELATIVEGCLPRAKPGQSHPATRTFQALRIAVNEELRELVRGLEAAERALKPGGWLAVVTFHSIEDRIVKRFLQLRSKPPRGSRHAPEAEPEPVRFADVARPVIAGETERADNPRARSARLRVARRTEAPAGPVDAAALGLPALDQEVS